MIDSKAPRFSVEGIRGVLIPVGQKSLLLPNAAVAEIVSFEPPTYKQGAPNWLLGYMDWRGLTIPLITWERLVENREPNWDEREPSGEKRRIRTAILNTLNGNTKLTHIGILSTGTIRLTRIRPGILKIDPQNPLTSEFIIESVYIDDVTAWIPNLDELERYIIETLEPLGLGVAQPV